MRSEPDSAAFAEHLAWSQQRSTGGALNYLRLEMQMERETLALSLSVPVQQIHAWEEAQTSIIPIDADRKLRELYLTAN